ncbi:NADH-quinone oxidoreductase subunit N [Nonomuraea rubra]|uniref:NADH-quinone oxidoreductase subunit N n=1 Tax=Nonomuraea rubra TaxID=46180 RepID=UPI00340EA655
MTSMAENPLDLLPELLILLGAVAGLLVGLFVPRRRQRVVAWICGLALVSAMAAAGYAMTRPDVMAFEAFAVDLPTNVTRLVVAGMTLLIVLLGAGRLRGHSRESEWYVLVLLAALGAIVLAGASDLLVFVAGYLLASIPAYALAGFGKDAHGTEAALKYYLMGTFLGVVMLAGVTLQYGLSGTTSYTPAPGVPAAAGVAVLFVLAGVLFKVGAVPAHFWVPDATQGSSAPVAAFITTVPKIGAFIGLLRLATEVFAGTWRPVLAVIAVATMTLGNLAAFYQDNVRRLLAYSTISQAGYLLLPVVVAGQSGLAQPALLFYVATYAVTNVGAFAVVVATGADSLTSYDGLGRRSPLLAFALLVCLLGLVGTPPTGVFVAKLLAFAAAWDGGYAWLAVIAVFNTVASVFYYLRWIVPLFRPGEPPAEPHPAASRVAGLSALLSILFGLASGTFLALSPSGPP